MTLNSPVSPRSSGYLLACWTVMSFYAPSKTCQIQHVARQIYENLTHRCKLIYSKPWQPMAAPAAISASMATTCSSCIQHLTANTLRVISKLTHKYGKAASQQLKSTDLNLIQRSSSCMPHRRHMRRATCILCTRCHQSHKERDMLKPPAQQQTIVRHLICRTLCNCLTVTVEQQHKYKHQTEVQTPATQVAKDAVSICFLKLSVV